MAAYSSQTVTQLKDLLKAKGLSIAGVKADLVARLEEADKINDELDEDVEEPAAAAADADADAAPAPATETEAAPAEAAAEPVAAAETAAAPVETATETPAEAPAEKKQLTPEELKVAATELLNTKIARARKFGSEDDVKKFEADIRRIEKFGITLDSPLARELGFVVAREKSFKGKPFNKRHHNHNGNRGFKGNSHQKKKFFNKRQ